MICLQRQAPHFSVWFADADRVFQSPFCGTAPSLVRKEPRQGGRERGEREREVFLPCSALGDMLSTKAAKGKGKREEWHFKYVRIYIHCMYMYTS